MKLRTFILFICLSNGAGAAHGNVLVSGMNCAGDGVQIAITESGHGLQATVYPPKSEALPPYICNVKETVPGTDLDGDRFHLHLVQDPSNSTHWSAQYTWWSYGSPMHSSEGTMVCSRRDDISVPRTCDPARRPSCRGMSMSSCIDGQWKCVPQRGRQAFPATEDSTSFQEQVYSGRQ
jgi:hypothetical protein